MTPYYTDDLVTLYHGDCLDVLAGLPDESVDAVITDPPYDMTANKKGGTGEASLNVNSPAGRSRISTGGGFMGKEWDATGIAFRPDVWREVLRVLKPGGHLLAFGAPRTYHRMAVAIEDAGFEIRDSLMWMFGSGFPKSHDIGKAIDRRPGVKRHAEFARHLAERREAAGLSRADVSESVVGTRSGACWNWEHHQFPEFKWWPQLAALLDLDPAWGDVIADAEREVTGTRAGNLLAVAPGQGSDRSATELDITAPATPEAQAWDGWGTALKPAHEPIVLARKPLTGTVASNVLTWGVGGLNVDGCRIGLHPDEDAPTGSGAASAASIYSQVSTSSGNGGNVTPTKGRWPANVILDDTAAALLDQQSGFSTSPPTDSVITIKANDSIGTFKTKDRTMGNGHGDSGGASRFFYTPKADRHERPRVDGVSHPTVKPVDLMAYLVRLVTPRGGIVLDPFAGTGTTAEAATAEGCRTILIEREADYLPLIVQRLQRPVEVTLW